MNAWTLDTLWDGQLALYQPRPGDGYRFNVDAVHLARFASEKPAKRALDLGSGVGAVGLSLLHLRAAAHVTLVDHEPRYLQLASKSIEALAWQSRVHCIERAVESLSLSDKFDLIVSNPPYTEPGAGRSSKAGSARQGALAPFVKAARAHLGARGRFACVYPAREWQHLLACLAGAGLVPKRARFVHAKSDAAARVVLVEASAGKPGGLQVDPPLIEVGTRDRE